MAQLLVGHLPLFWCSNPMIHHWKRDHCDCPKSHGWRPFLVLAERLELWWEAGHVRGSAENQRYWSPAYPWQYVFRSIFIYYYIIIRRWSKIGLHLSVNCLQLGWILILYAQNPWYLYSARFISGFSGSLAFVAIPFLVAEVADDSIRGALASMLTVATNGGVLTGFIVGNFFDYNTVPKILIGFPVLFVICYQFFPESPWYLVHSNRLVEAEASLRFYRNMKLNVDKKVEEVFQLEFQRLRVLHEEAMKEKLTKPSVTMADFGKNLIFWGNYKHC